MALELIYTSVPQGLLPGRTGFCTVAMTRGMSQQMSTKLEGLVAYTPVFEHFSQNSAFNPASVFHYSITDGRNSYDLLARVSSCGLDYTKRSNKIGHFILLSESERRQFADGPSCLLNDSNLFATEWHGQPQYIPNERALNANAVSSTRANAWEKATGDAGWAAWLAEWYLAKPDEPCFVIFDPLHQTNMQELVAESLMLLPKNKRWMVTWNTYMTALPLGLPSCNWRFCVANQSMMNAIGCVAGANVLDLRQKLGKARDSRLNQCARTGESPYAEQKSINLSSLSLGSASVGGAKEMTLAERKEAQRQAQEREKQEALERTRKAQDREKIQLSGNRPALRRKEIEEPAVESRQSFEGIEEKKKKKPYLPFALGSIIGFLLAAILCLTAYYFVDVNGKAKLDMKAKDGGGLEKAQAEPKKAEEELNKVKEELNKVKDKLKKTEEDLKKAKAEVEELKNPEIKAQKAKKAADDAKKAADDAKKAADDAKKVVDDLEKQLNDVKTKITECEKSIQDKEKEVKDKTDEANKASNTMKKRLEEEAKAAEEKKNLIIKNSLNPLNTQANGLNVKLKKAKDDFANLDKKANDARAKYNDLDNKAKEAKEKADELAKKAMEAKAKGDGRQQTTSNSQTQSGTNKKHNANQ